MMTVEFPLQKALENFSPPVPRLQHLCAKTFLRLVIDYYASSDSEEDLMTASNIYLPPGVGEEVMRQVRDSPEAAKMGAKRFDLFMSHDRVPLLEIDLHGTLLYDKCLVHLLKEHGGDLFNLSIAYCEKLTESVNALIAEKVTLPRLRVLDISGLTTIFAHILFQTNDANVRVPVVPLSDVLVLMPPQNRRFACEGKNDVENMDTLYPADWSCSDECGTSASVTSTVRNYKLLTAVMPNLQALIFHMDAACNEATADNVARLFSELLGSVRSLSYLDLSCWRHLSTMQFLTPLDNLTTLILYDVSNLYQAIDSICALKTLKYLDLSQHNRANGEFDRPVTTIDRLVRSLPYLTALDISGTNLTVAPTNGDWPGADDEEEMMQEAYVDSDITGLRHLRKTLKFLGIFGCGSAHFRRLPAKIIAGEFNEEQLFISMEQYLHRPLMLLKVLNEAYQLYRFESASMHRKALEFMLLVMKEHPNNVNVQIAGSACLFYILRYVDIRQVHRQRVIDVLLTSMETHSAEQTMVRNCCLSLCQFEFPNDLFNNYMRAINILLIVLEQFDDVMTQRIVVHLLNTMACHVNGAQKLSVGEFRAVEKILRVIGLKYDDNLCDEVMEVAWSFLWNITDEAPENCARFLNEHGMTVFYNCFLKFPDRNELLRNMMGLVGNIAEVPSLRVRLMEECFVSAFFHLLENLSDGIEISYNSAGVLAHLLSDGVAAWTIKQPTWQEVTEALIKVVNGWHIRSRRFINYRSFEPMIRLLPLFDSPASQHWAVWALANLTTVDGPKYCEYVWNECGLKSLRLIEQDERSPDNTKAFAKIAIDNVIEWMKTGLEDGLLSQHSR